MKVPTGGDGVFSAPQPTNPFGGRSGANPEPTVIVRMEEDDSQRGLVPLTVDSLSVLSFALMCSACCGAHLFLSSVSGRGMANTGAFRRFYAIFFQGRELCLSALLKKPLKTSVTGK